MGVNRIYPLQSHQSVLGITYCVYQDNSTIHIVPFIQWPSSKFGLFTAYSILLFIIIVTYYNLTSTCKLEEGYIHVEKL